MRYELADFECAAILSYRDDNRRTPQHFRHRLETMPANLRLGETGRNQVHGQQEACRPLGVRSNALWLGSEPINSERSANVCFGAHTGLKSDIAPIPEMCQ